MNVFRKKLITPADQFSNNQTYKANGWKWPPHPCQLISGVVYLYYGFILYAILIPLLPSWGIAIYNTFTALLLYGHILLYFLAISIDASHENVHIKNKGVLPVWSKARKTQVIGDRYCFICDVEVGSKSVHCSRCNKCVDEFNCHSIWLNNCVGHQNRKFYLGALISGFFLHLLVGLLTSIVLVAYVVNRKWLRSHHIFATISDAQTWIALLPVAPVYISTPVFLTITLITAAISLLVLLYLIYLLRHNIYILRKWICKHKYRMQSTDCPVAMEEGQSTSQSMEKVAGGHYAEFGRTSLFFECNTLTGSATTDTSQNLHDSDVKPSTSKMANDPVPTISARVHESHGKKALKDKKRDTSSFLSLIRGTRSALVQPLSEQDQAIVTSSGKLGLCNFTLCMDNCEVLKYKGTCESTTSTVETATTASIITVSPAPTASSICTCENDGQKMPAVRKWICKHKYRMQSTDCPVAMEEGQSTSQSMEKVAGGHYAEFGRTSLFLTGSATTDTSQNLHDSDVKPSTSKMANDPVPTISARVHESHGKKALKDKKRDTSSFLSLIRGTRSVLVQPLSEQVRKWICKHKYRMQSTDCPVAMEEGQSTSQSMEKVAGGHYAEFGRTSLFFECNTLTGSATTDTSQNLHDSDVKPSTSKMANDPVPTISARVHESHGKKALKDKKRDTSSFLSLIRGTRSVLVQPLSEQDQAIVTSSGKLGLCNFTLCMDNCEVLKYKGTCESTTSTVETATTASIITVSPAPTASSICTCENDGQKMPAVRKWICKHKYRMQSTDCPVAMEEGQSTSQSMEKVAGGHCAEFGRTSLFLTGSATTDTSQNLHDSDVKPSTSKMANDPVPTISARVHESHGKKALKDKKRDTSSFLSLIRGTRSVLVQPLSEQVRKWICKHKYRMQSTDCPVAMEEGQSTSQSMEKVAGGHCAEFGRTSLFLTGSATTDTSQNLHDSDVKPSTSKMANDPVPTISARVHESHGKKALKDKKRDTSSFLSLIRGTRSALVQPLSEQDQAIVTSSGKSALCNFTPCMDNCEVLKYKGTCESTTRTVETATTASIITVSPAPTASSICTCENDGQKMPADQAIVTSAGKSALCNFTPCMDNCEVLKYKGTCESTTSTVETATTASIITVFPAPTASSICTCENDGQKLPADQAIVTSAGKSALCNFTPCMDNCEVLKYKGTCESATSTVETTTTASIITVSPAPTASSICTCENDGQKMPADQTIVTSSGKSALCNFTPRMDNFEVLKYKGTCESTTSTVETATTASIIAVSPAPTASSICTCENDGQKMPADQAIVTSAGKSALCNFTPCMDNCEVLKYKGTCESATSTVETTTTASIITVSPAPTASSICTCENDGQKMPADQAIVTSSGKSALWNFTPCMDNCEVRKYKGTCESTTSTIETAATASLMTVSPAPTASSICTCENEGQKMPADQVIVTSAGKSGLCNFTLCLDNCEVLKYKGTCESTTSTVETPTTETTMTVTTIPTATKNASRLHRS
ncbi:uncharacterized protein [Narcine bancroftii]|uniref:uncharacterized protein isoform X2 n=1 Tax=Narcine bancroftii TaxID=1343680 RepID=UPI003831FCD4